MDYLGKYSSKQLDEMVPSHDEIYEEIEIHSDNGISPQFLVKMVSEVLGVKQSVVKPVWKEWMRDSGWSV